MRCKPLAMAMPAVVIAVFGSLGLIDLAFLSSNALKIVQGGWLPLAMAARVFVLMDTWRRGPARRIWNICATTRWRWTCSWSAPTRSASASRARPCSWRRAPTSFPVPLLHSLKHYKVLHERVVLAIVTVDERPIVPGARAG